MSSLGNAGQIAFVCDTAYGQIPKVIQSNDAWASGGTGFSAGCGNVSGINGNISSDPLFVTGKYTLKGGSPVVDAGINSAPDLPSRDFVGNPRIVNGNDGPSSIVDMGAY